MIMCYINPSHVIVSLQLTEAHTLAKDLQLVKSDLEIKVLLLCVRACMCACVCLCVLVCVHACVCACICTRVYV